MMDILSNKEHHKIIDCTKIAYNGQSPITYADIKVTEEGKIEPSEVALTNSDDYLTCQSLDYIF